MLWVHVVFILIINSNKTGCDTIGNELKMLLLRIQLLLVLLCRMYNVTFTETVGEKNYITRAVLFPHRFNSCCCGCKSKFRCFVFPLTLNKLIRKIEEVM